MAGIDAFGTQWKMHDGASTYVTIEEVTNVGVLSIDVDTIDVSSHDSPSQWREFLGGMKDGGELSMEINYDPALHGSIMTAIGATRNHKIILPDAGAAEVSFAAVVSGFSAGAPYDDKLSGTVTLKVSGAVTVTP